MNPAPMMAFSHMGIYVCDMEKMLDFYTEVLGFSVTDRANIRGRDLVFISRNPEEHHQIVLVPGREAGSLSTINQISFRVVSLPELRRIHAELDKLGIPLNPTNHGGAWSVYFPDPEGNRIELFAQTPWYMPPVSVPLDMNLSDEEILRLTEAMVTATPGHMSRVDWHEETRRRLIEEGTLERRG
jgi:catechol 2,3-dioxygenase